MKRRKDGWKRAKQLSLTDKLITPSGTVRVGRLEAMGGMIGETYVVVTVTDQAWNLHTFTYDWNAKVKVK